MMEWLQAARHIFSGFSQVSEVFFSQVSEVFLRCVYVRAQRESGIIQTGEKREQRDEQGMVLNWKPRGKEQQRQW